MLAQIDEMASALTSRFGLIGVNGLDIVIGRDPDGVARPYLLEVNPRFSGSMELAERAFGVNVFSLHVESAARAPAAMDPACSRRSRRQGHRLRAATPSPHRTRDGGWRVGVRDVPPTGQRIAAGHPVCTVLAQGADRRGVPCRPRSAASAVYADAQPAAARGAARNPLVPIDAPMRRQIGGMHPGTMVR